MNMPDIVVNQLSNGLTGILNKPLKNLWNTWMLL